MSLSYWQSILINIKSLIAYLRVAIGEETAYTWEEMFLYNLNTWVLIQDCEATVSRREHCKYVVITTPKYYYFWFLIVSKGPDAEVSPLPIVTVGTGRTIKR